MDNSTLEAQWVWDSESGEEYLLDLKTGQVLAKRSDICPNA